ncbi:MAG: hypothetical protein E1N59_2707 [Puniceicoccaceae bacterium 5H]|nr:MAG: hypothetical protein E1N59_2707 [Puniceicoccaceae bacterium 5H]
MENLFGTRFRFTFDTRDHYRLGFFCIPLMAKTYGTVRALSRGLRHHSGEPRLFTSFRPENPILPV